MSTARKKWIVPGDARRCADHNCEGYDTKTAKITAIDADGTIHSECKLCTSVRTTKADKWRERKACEDCGHVRNVMVREWRTVGRPGETYWQKLCDACEADKAGRIHMAQAQKLFAKARKIREAREAKKDHAIF